MTDALRRFLIIDANVLIDSVPVLWGLELMIELVAEGLLPREAALEVAWSIQRVNPRHITPEILQRFAARLVL